MNGTIPDPSDPDNTASRPPAVDLRKLSETMYQTMRAVGGGMMKHEDRDHLLSPTALVGAAIERMLENDQSRFNDRSHLLAAAAIAMRRVLVEHARSENCVKRGGGRGRTSWDDVVHAVSTREDPLLVIAIDEAIDAISREDDRYGRIVEMRLFGALNNPEIAHVLGVSLSTIEKDWKYVRSKLLTMLALVRD